jgi:hypothetical protein
VTVATAAVSAVAKGDADVDDEIEFAYTPPGSGPEAPRGLRAGGEYVLLLEPSTDSPAFLVSSIQGYYVIVDNRAVPDRSNPVILSAGVRKKLGLA